MKAVAAVILYFIYNNIIIQCSPRYCRNTIVRFVLGHCSIINIRIINATLSNIYNTHAYKKVCFIVGPDNTPCCFPIVVAILRVLYFLFVFFFILFFCYLHLPPPSETRQDSVIFVPATPFSSTPRQWLFVYCLCNLYICYGFHHSLKKTVAVTTHEISQTSANNIYNLNEKTFFLDFIFSKAL